MNKKLENLFHLSSIVAVIIPATINVNEDIDNTPYVERFASKMSELFGGATSCQCLGYWQSSALGLVKEKSTKVFSYCEQHALEENIDVIITMCEELKEELSQEAIALEINGTMYFV